MTEEERRAYEEQDRQDAVNRRDFLKIIATSFAALTSAGCKLRPPKEKIVPYLEQPEDAVPGVTRWYASTCGGCTAACGTLVKSRDGRPIKMEGNPDHPLSRGGLCARGQATILDLYDGQRLMHPLNGDVQSSWSSLDSGVAAGLTHAKKQGKSIRILSETIISPSLKAAINTFARSHDAQHVVYDAISCAAIIEAHQRTHGRAVLPHYHFDQARVIVSFGADFLGTWISPVEFTKAWSANRVPDRSGLMSWHAQFESRLSLTGSSADARAALKPSQELSAIMALGRLIAQRTGWAGSIPHVESSPLHASVSSLIKDAAQQLLAARQHSLIVSGSADTSVQIAVNWINEMLGSYGQTLDISRPALQRQGRADALEHLVGEMKRGEVGALIIVNSNPAYDHALAADFTQAIKNVSLTVSLSERRDETASLCRWVATASNALESWGDAMPSMGVVSLFQPLVSPFFDTRTPLESFLMWAGQPTSAYDFIKERWRTEIFPQQKDLRSFSAFWDESVRKGAWSMGLHEKQNFPFSGAALSAVRAQKNISAGSFELQPYPSIALFDGRQANNPWLQELPDPVTKVSWGNYACFSPADAARLGLEDGRMVKLSSGRVGAVELPACIQPGQAEGVIAVPLGYGRTAAGPIAANYPMVKILPIERDTPGGVNIYPLSSELGVLVTVLSGSAALAKTQTYDSMTVPFTGETRPLARSMTLAAYREQTPEKNSAEEAASENGLWPRHEYKGHKWGLAVNLASCTGCSGCVVACQVENNVPIVGKAEVRKGREMHWIRIDRYYKETPDAASPEVAFQPMMCQHCDNAPCETVCPVLATVHSTEGLNMQVYNRCVGTRYCANNCPYKVRRFNWFDYAHEDLLQNMALNSDVTVRTRGVMEKCSFCVQRIYSAKFDAKSQGRELKDGDVVPACAQSCAADAIVFGDLNDPNSRVSKLARDEHSYRALTELGVGPSVFYQVKVRNTDEETT